MKQKEHLFNVWKDKATGKYYVLSDEEVTKFNLEGVRG